MADGRVLLAAHDGDAKSADAGFEALDAGQERGRFREAPIEDVAVRVVKVAAFGPAAEFFAQKQILDAGLLEGLLQLFAREVGDIGGIGRGAHIRDDLNVMLLQEGEKPVQRVIRVADGEQMRRGNDWIHA